MPRRLPLLCSKSHCYFCLIQFWNASHNFVLIIPTGGGKTICYAMPALKKHQITVVIFPLLALLDQVERIWWQGLNICYFMSAMEGLKKKLPSSNYSPIPQSTISSLQNRRQYLLPLCTVCYQNCPFLLLMKFTASTPGMSISVQVILSVAAKYFLFFCISFLDFRV